MSHFQTIERIASRLFFDKAVTGCSWSISDPTSEQLKEALHRLRYEPKHMTDSDRFIVCSAAEDYCFLTTYPLGVEHCIRKLRSIWQALRQLESK